MLATFAAGCDSRCFAGPGGARCASASGADLLPSAIGFSATPYVAGPLPSRSLESSQYSTSGPAANDTLNTSSYLFFVICVSIQRPPAERW